MKTKYHFSFGETRRIYFAGGETLSYDLEFSSNQKEKGVDTWVNQKLNQLDRDIFQDAKLTIDETKTLLNKAKDINWKNDGHTGYVAALQAALKHINTTKSANCDPGVLDAVMLKGKGQGQTKQALMRFQEWYNSIYSQNITVDGEPGHESVRAILQVLGEDSSVPVPAEEPIAEEPVAPVDPEPAIDDVPEEVPVVVSPPVEVQDTIPLSALAEPTTEPQIVESSPPVESLEQKIDISDISELLKSVAEEILQAESVSDALNAWTKLLPQISIKREGVKLIAQARKNNEDIASLQKKLIDLLKKK